MNPLTRLRLAWDAGVDVWRLFTLPPHKYREKAGLNLHTPPLHEREERDAA